MVIFVNNFGLFIQLLLIELIYFIKVSLDNYKLCIMNTVFIQYL